MEKVIAVFDIGKTNKKLLLFNGELKVVFQHEEKFPTVTDEDGFECDDMERIEKWVVASLNSLVAEGIYDLLGVNFSTYGASLAFVDEKGNRLTPIYNYLKPIDDKYCTSLFGKYGGEAEFCRKTASPALGVMLNSGIQLAWMKGEHGEVLAATKHILHFPQYLSYVLTGEAVSEYTSIGCHTYMWDFDKMQYHQWLADEGFQLPVPVSNTTTYQTSIAGKKVPVGIGIHDSSASLVPYFQGCSQTFLLISTGTWCINMNPFNHTPLTAEELKRDCLSYMSVNQKPVKSSRLFMGHIHDVNVARLVDHYKVDGNSFKKVVANGQLIQSLLNNTNYQRCFFNQGVPEGYVDNDVDLLQFSSFNEAYHRFMYDLTLVCADSIGLVSNGNDGVNNIFVSGGFARNEIFVRLLANLFPHKKVFTSEVDNSSALGAALVILNKAMPWATPTIDLGLAQWEGF